MEKKICSKCKIEYAINNFHLRSKNGKYRSHCKICHREDRNKKYKQNIEEEKLKAKDYREKNREVILQKKKVYYKSNSEIYRKWRKNNPDKIKNTQRKFKKKPKTKMSNNVRRRLSQYLKLNNISIKNKTFEIIGCTPEFLKEHLERQFQDNMCWGNYGYCGWHIDHIIPLSSAKTEEDFYKLSHYTNLQPLWAKDNLSKGNKIITLMN